jgi:hypothetical protein
MKAIFAIAVLAMSASSALAQNASYFPNYTSWDRHGASTQGYQAYGSATQQVGPRTVGPRRGVIVNGEVRGWDPDARVREQLLRDPPHAG